MEILVIVLLAVILAALIVLIFLAIKNRRLKDSDINSIKVAILKEISKEQIENALIKSNADETMKLVNKFNDLEKKLLELLNGFKLDLMKARNEDSDLLYGRIKDMTNSFTLVKETLIKELSETRKNVNDELNKKIIEINKFMVEFSDKTMKFLEDKINHLNDTVKGKLDEGFKKTNESFMKMIESINLINEAQKNIQSVQKDITSLQNVLTDKKSRGTFGEVQLNTILYNVFGEFSKNSPYELQYQFKDDLNSVKADAVIKCPEPVGLLAIDSKFPLENYKNMLNANSEVEKLKYSKLFDSDCKKHIEAISSKYIIPGVTSNQAIMFLPSEAIFAEINANHYNIINYAQTKNVWLTSPTTLMAFLTTIATLLQNIKYSKNILVIRDNITKLAAEFNRYKERWESLQGHINQVSKDVHEINITTNKITNKFSEITASKQIE